ncbi:MAG TPA: HAMP domain-containing sensor histidine kinase [Cyclobacteriaceae bacterium]
MRNIFQFGISPKNKLWQNRNIVAANSIAWIVALVAGLLTLLHSLLVTFDLAGWIVAAVCMLLLTIPFISKTGYINLSRFLLVFFTVMGALTVTIARKYFDVGTPELGTYYQPRVILIIFCAIPLTIFNFKERLFLFGSSAFGLLTLLLFDPIHELLGVGYYQVGYQSENYYITNLYFLFAYLFFIGIVGYFKMIREEYEVKNQELMKTQLQRNALIQDQKHELENKSYVLNQLLQEKDKDMGQVAQELLKFNQELMQYSYALSHNLRGPVARLLGLFNLMGESKTDAEKQQFYKLAVQELQALDIIIFDLNKIAETRGETYQIMEKVKFEDVFQETTTLLQSHIIKCKARVQADFQKSSEIFTVKDRLSYIMFTLISNALQYRKPGGSLEIKIRTFRQDDFVILEVEDNGLGIDLHKHGADLFKPFKRFNLRASGRGLGLYLTKLQVEKLFGRIEVKSTPEIGSVFIVYFKDLEKE